MYLAPVIELQELLRQLALQRPLFHSEADFQHALAWELHSFLPGSRVRLELPLGQFDRQRHLDIYLKHDGRELALELKYKTRALAVTKGGERFQLKDQSAQPIGQYDFIKDIQRIEQMADGRQNAKGYAIFLTNDSAYWKRPGRAATVAREFSLYDGRRLEGRLNWQSAGAGTKNKREEELHLHGAYLLNWHDYSQPSTASYGRFRYLLVEVTA